MINVIRGSRRITRITNQMKEQPRWQTT